MRRKEKMKLVWNHLNAVTTHTNYKHTHAHTHARTHTHTNVCTTPVVTSFDTTEKYESHLRILTTLR